MHTGGGAEAAATVGGALERLPSRASIQGPHAPHDASWPAAMDVERPAAMDVERGGDVGSMATQRSVPQRSHLPHRAASVGPSTSLHPLHPFPDYSRSAGMQLPPLLLSVPPPAQPSLLGGQPAVRQAIARFPPAASLPVPAAADWTPATGSLAHQLQHCGAWGSPGLSPLAQTSRSSSMPGARQQQQQQQQQHSAAATPQCSQQQQQQQYQHRTAAIVVGSGAAAGPVAAAVTNTAAPSPPASGSQEGSPTASLPHSGQAGSAPAGGQPLASVDAEPPCPLPFDRLQRQRMSSSGTDAPGGVPLPHLPAPALAYLLPQGLQLTAGMALLPSAGLDSDTSGLKQDRASTAAELQHLLAMLGSAGGPAREALPTGLSGLQLASGGSSGNGSPIVQLAGPQPGE